MAGAAPIRRLAPIYEGDCNTILLDQVFPRVRFEDYRRALCMLDPYGLHLNWEVIPVAADIVEDIFRKYRDAGKL